MKNELTDNYLSKAFQNDKLDCTPDSSIKSRLDYTFMLKESQNKIRQNSFLGLFTWIFSGKNLPLKAAFISLLVLLSIFNFQQKPGNFESPVVDSASVLTIPFNIDSVTNKPFKSDTCSFPGI
ncbi:hypothetical protein [Maribellus maritimus]|uniref:hypothetical protein n=1 Tax=Maribellus maritimus TaxID=2870838 RepID=UPI001EEBE74F|nr:hypothetical protein [Maribellus maritimus]MCG6188569.1 hypothetical protein [Maribellus maritimus]